MVATVMMMVITFILFWYLDHYVILNTQKTESMPMLMLCFAARILP